MNAQRAKTTTTIPSITKTTNTRATVPNPPNPHLPPPNKYYATDSKLPDPKFKRKSPKKPTTVPPPKSEAKIYPPPMKKKTTLTISIPNFSEVRAIRNASLPIARGARIPFTRTSIVVRPTADARFYRQRHRGIKSA